MTSTNHNIGFEGRISSRVLKPPGGGHSDIFGVHEDNFSKPKSRQNHGSSITDCFRSEETVTKTVTIENSAQVVEQKTEAIITTTTTNEQNGNGEVITTEQVENGKVEVTEKIENGKNEENIKPEENKNEIDKPEQNGKTSSAPQRVRVPPGGFSSGFW